MKDSIITVRNFLLVLGFCCISISGNSQDLKLTRKEKKEIKKAEKFAAFEALSTTLKGRQFVFESNRPQGSTGSLIYNVVQIDRSRIFVRCDDPPDATQGLKGAANNYAGFSTYTGLYFEGDIQNWELTEHSKNQSYSIRFKAYTNAGGVFEISMTINPINASIEIRDKRGKSIYTNYTGKIRTS